MGKGREGGGDPGARGPVQPLLREGQRYRRYRGRDGQTLPVSPVMVKRILPHPRGAIAGRAGGGRARRAERAGRDARGGIPPPPPCTKWTRRVPHPVLIGHAASLAPY